MSFTRGPTSPPVPTLMPDGQRPPAAPGLAPDERALLDRAWELSLRGWGWTAPNPMVGCVLAREGEAVGEGWHAECGGPHAEAEALRRAGGRARGATAFVTLEPCAHRGRTPPCAQALLEAGIRRVVFGAADPGPGRGGARWLEERGVVVEGPVWSRLAARTHNPAFFHDQGSGAPGASPRLPYLAIKLAVSRDGFISEAPGVRSWITGAEAQVETHRLRSGFDAVAVGSITAKVDDPLLTVRRAPVGRRPPARIVIDSRASLPPSSRMLSGGPPVHVMASRQAEPAGVEALRAAGARVHLLPASGSRVDLHAALELAGELGMRSLLCEGGGELASALLARGLASNVHIFSAPKLLGPGGVPAFPGAVRSGWRAAEPARLLGEDELQVYEIDGERAGVHRHG